MAVVVVVTVVLVFVALACACRGGFELKRFLKKLRIVVIGPVGVFAWAAAAVFGATCSAVTGLGPWAVSADVLVTYAS